MRSMHPSQRHQANQNGVTLIELMVTLAILAVLVGLAAPGMTDLIRDARLSSQTDALVSALNLARLEAVKQRRDVTFCPAATPDTASACSAVATDWAKGWLILNTDGVLQRLPSKTGLVITNASTTVVFSGTLGSTTETSFTLCVTGRKQQTVSVAASGHVSKSVGGTICS